MALIATTILMFAVCISASAKGKRNVERGMTKQEVIAILGDVYKRQFQMFIEKIDAFRILYSSQFHRFAAQRRNINGFYQMCIRDRNYTAR